jgi:processive 1,2-diacylglycerol beta-glucosyltransferase
MAGKNETLQERLKQISYVSNVPIKIVGYTDKVHELMNSADLLISKPGGLTCAEALSIGLPMIVAEPIPGQEERNSRFIIESGVGLKLENSKQLKGLIEDLINNRDKLTEMREKALSLGKPEAALSVCKLLKQLYLT